MNREALLSIPSIEEISDFEDLERVYVNPVKSFQLTSGM